MSDEPAGDDSVVNELDPDCTVEDIEEGKRYLGVVDGVVEYGVFVELAPAVSGLIHESNFAGAYAVGDEIIVEVLAIKDNQDVSFVPIAMDEYQTVTVEHAYDVVSVDELTDHIGETVHIEGEVVQIKQTGGPTLFHVSDASGIVPCAAFETAGVRAFPEIENGGVVHATGTMGRYDDGLQLEVNRLAPISDDRVDEIEDELDAALHRRASPHEIDPLVEWSALSALFPGLERVARRLRRAVLANRPVVIRHHADTDGMCASIPVAEALTRFIRSSHLDPDASRHLVRRLPSRAPYYEMEDVTRDLSRALENRDRHGQKLPVLVMIDNGSTAEDIPAYQQLDMYDIPVIVIDHHSPDDAVTEYLDEHVNPYLTGDDYRITAGMMCVELARMIDPDLTESVRHIPAVAGVADRSAADEMSRYFELAEANGVDANGLDAIGDALDYAAYQLRYNAGQGLVNDVIGIGEKSDENRQVIELLAGRATRKITRQLELSLPHVETEVLDNDIELFSVDLDRHARRFTYPPPGKTTGAIHDRMVQETDGPVITIGYGPDFAVLRSDRVRLDIPQMVSELNEELGGAGVSGGGHLVVGSIRFVSGMREPVIDALVDKMTMAEIDESLGATAPRSYPVSNDHSD